MIIDPHFFSSFSKTAQIIIVWFNGFFPHNFFLNIVKVVKYYVTISEYDTII